MEAPRQVEMILKHGDVSSTYKFALLKSIIDYVIAHPTEDARNGFHYIPGIYLARQFMRYYWPLWRHEIPQNPTGRTAMASVFEDFQAKVDHDLYREPNSVFKIIEKIETSGNLPTTYVKLLQDIRNTVIDMPVRYIRNVRGEVAQLFTVTHREHPLINADFEEIIDEGKKVIKNSSSVQNYLELEEKEPFYLLIADRVYDELSELRFWIDSIVTRHWMEQCVEYSDEYFKYGDFFSSLAREPGERMSLDPYRELYDQHNFPDFYMGNSLRSDFHIDHFLPWSRLPVNRFWNLVPTRPSINSKKSDRLIELTDKIREDRLREHLDCCLATGSELIKRDLRSTYHKYYKQKELPEKREQKVEELRQLVLTLYDDLDQQMFEEKYKLKESA